jgi:hypothetical protein
MGLLQKFKDKMLLESNLSRIYQHTKESNIGIITAYRGEFDIKQNEERNKKLKSAIHSMGFGYIPVTGYYVENKGLPDERKVHEKSFILISHKDDGGRLRSFLIKMGIKFNQDSVFYKDQTSENGTIIGTAAGRHPGLNNVESVGKFHPQKIGTYYTQLKNKKTFVFESIVFLENLMSRAHREMLLEKKDKLLK